MEQVLILTPRIESNQLQTVILAFVVIHANQRVTRLKITDSRSPVMMTAQTPILAGQINEYYNYFFAHGISNYAGSGSLYSIVAWVFAGKLVKNSFTRC